MYIILLILYIQRKIKQKYICLIVLSGYLYPPSFFIKSILLFIILYTIIKILIIIIMFNFVRKVVAGPKKTTSFQGQQLDLTYITHRIIAMAFPASELLEKAYRNPIEQVAAYLEQNHHVNYFIFNVSSRFYDHSEFSGRVKDYEWPDHQAPPLTTLIQIGFDMYAYLKGNDQRVIAVHCNHGKGRTGTAIITLMLLVGYFNSYTQCLKYYNQKRFNNKTYGVDQPCQLRYLRFIQQILTVPTINNKLICYHLNKVTQRGLSNSCFLNIYSTRTQKIIFEKLQFDSLLEEKQKYNIMTGDIFIEIMEHTWKGSTRIARINYNLYFNPQSMQVTFHSQNIKLENYRFQDFQISLNMQYFCLCHLPTYSETVCSCKAIRNIEEAYWNNMISHIKKCKKINPKDSILLIQGYMNKLNEKYEDVQAYNEQKRIMRKDADIKGESAGQVKFKNNHKQKLCALIQTTMQRKIDIGQPDIIMEQEHDELPSQQLAKGREQQVIVVGKECQQSLNIINDDIQLGKQKNEGNI